MPTEHPRKPAVTTEKGLPLSERDFYTSQSRFSDPGGLAALFANLPTAVGELAQIVRNVVMHREDAGRYGVSLTEERKNEAETRYISKILSRITELRDAPLAESRQHSERFAGVCRDYALLLCSIFRHQGVPSRVRCGFAAYFTPNFYEDHWVCEYWKEGSGWTLVDAELGPDEIADNHISFDPLDVPRDQFVVGGDAWQQCRSGKQDGDRFGVGVISLSGMWFVRNNAVRDLAALNKVEVLPWDEWGLAETPFEDLTEDDIRLLDLIAGLEQQGGPLVEIQSAFRDDSRFSTPSSVRSHTTYGGERVVRL